jgi:UDP-N-acetylglucosamine--N-acetylmuramyl-(pentapeptide) pyrophosphoryl-undecaprenol N-acetylglucosamine transferase
VAAGGTGGHLFPAQAFAREMLRRGHRVVLMTDKRFLAYKDGFGDVEVRTVLSGHVSGPLLKKIKGAFCIVGGLAQAGLTLMKLKPQAVIGFGGYPSFPTMAAAIELGIPTVLHEQNRLMGKVNRLIAGKVSKLALSFESTQRTGSAKAENMVVTGNPVRDKIAALHDKAYPLLDESGPIHLLVFGGSQGARVFSEVLPQALGKLDKALQTRLRITQQCRKEDLEAARALYQQLGIQANLAPFFGDMEVHIAAAHLVICRAGASTVAEMTMAGRPAIYVPYPYAAEDHQRLNADYAVGQGAGWLLLEQDFTAERMAGELAVLFKDRQKLAEAAANAKSLAKVNAAAALADVAERLNR